MTTTKQITANRRNASKSTGPRTESGKARSARNALKHGLTAEQVVMLDEDPAAFDALRSDLIKFYQPAGPVAEHLVEQVAASIWRLRRVPRIEAGVFTHFYFRRETNLAIDKVHAQEYHFGRPTGADVLNKTAHAAAKKDQKRAEAELRSDKPVLGAVFRDAEHTLTSLVRIAGAIEASMFRATRELAQMKTERQEPVNDNSIIDAEVDESSNDAVADEEDWLV